MKRKSTIIISLYLLIVIISPLIVTLKDHHQHFYDRKRTQKYFHEFLRGCEVCNFEFSSRLSKNANIVLTEAILTENFCNNYNFLAQ